MFMNVDLTAAKTNVEFLAGYKSDPYKMYSDLEAEGGTLTEKLESTDASDINPATGLPEHGVDALSRALMAADIKLAGPGAIMISQLVDRGLVLMPELVLREIQAGMKMTKRSDYTKLVASTVESVGPSYHPAYIPNLNQTAPASTIGLQGKSLAKRAAAAKGGMFPKTSIRYREKDIVIKDYGREFDVSYKMLKAMPWTEFAIFLHLVGVQLAGEKLFDIYDLAITGDGTVGAATDTFSGTSGSLVYTDLVDNYVSYDQAFEMNAMLCPQSSLETILTMAQFQDPQAGFSFQRTGELVTPIGSELFQVPSVPSTTPTATVIATLDKRFAVRETNSQKLMVEAKKIIELKFEEAVVSEETVFSIIADGALKRIVWT